LSATSAFAIKTAFSFFKQNALEGFDVSLEATHHQPFNLNTPSLFIEVGSSENEWRNERACALVAECVAETAKNYLNASGKTAIGMGAGHYCPSFNELEASDYAFSFITPKHSLDFVTADLVKQEIAKTREGVECAAIDWKGCGREQRKKVIDACEQAGLPWEKV
jgi:D-aminoacyl-tRNA deacylase